MNPITSVNQDNIVSDTQLTPTLIKCNETIKVEQFDKNNVIPNKNPNNNISLIDPYWYRPEIKNKLHSIDILWTSPPIKQIISKAVRYSSHNELPKDERTVKTFIYKSKSE
jgi:hypothetical protein